MANKCVGSAEHRGPHAMATQDRIAAWVRGTFGEEHAANAPERSIRTVEEALELAQACGVDVETLHRLVAYVFSRPVGTVEQEVAGCMVTLYATASAAGVDADAAFEVELARIHRPEIVERCRRRQSEKRAALIALDGAEVPTAAERKLVEKL